jgi:hypothetical protein
MLLHALIIPIANLRPASAYAIIGLYSADIADLGFGIWDFEHNIDNMKREMSNTIRHKGKDLLASTYFKSLDASISYVCHIFVTLSSRL